MSWVLDTNVLVSGMLKAGSPPQWLLLKAAEGAFEWVVSSKILTEYREVLKRPKFKIREADAKAMLDLMQGGIWVDPKPSQRYLPDPHDLAFLDAALMAGAEAIVTGNQKHFPAAKCRPVIILTPRQALEVLERR